MSLINNGNLATSLAAALTGANANGNANSNSTKPEKKVSELWLNVGITIPGAGKDGADLFVSLPVGIPLDDIKPVQVRGNGDYAQLNEAKNALLELAQKTGAQLAPGGRQITKLQVEIYRKAEDRTGQPTNTGNPLVAGMLSMLAPAA